MGAVDFITLTTINPQHLILSIPSGIDRSNSLGLAPRKTPQLCLTKSSKFKLRRDTLVSNTIKFNPSASGEIATSPRKIRRAKSSPRVSRIDPELVPTTLVTATRMLMNLTNIDPANNPDVPLKRNPSGYITTPRNRTVAYLARTILSDVTTCSYCWKNGDHEFGPDGLVWGLDHVIPLCKGGIENLSNIVKCCQTCNTKKARRIIAPHPMAAWAASSSVEGLYMWHNARDIHKKITRVQPFTVDYTDSEEFIALLNQWNSTCPA